MKVSGDGIMTMNILVVDDEISVRDTICNIISQVNNYEINIIQAESGEDALQVLSGVEIQLLITDICMSGIDGITLARKARELNANCGIVIISAYDHKEYLKAAIEIKTIAYIDKPIDKAKLLNVLDEVFSKYQSNDVVVHQEKKHNYKEIIEMLTSSKPVDETNNLLNVLFDKSLEHYCFMVSVLQFSCNGDYKTADIMIEKTLSEANETVKNIFYKKNKNTYIIIFYSEDEVCLESNADKILSGIENKLYPHTRVLVSSGNVKKYLNDIYKSYEDAVFLIERGFYGNYGFVNKTIAVPHEYKKVGTIKIIDDFNKVLVDGNKMEVTQFLESICMQIKEEKSCPKKLSVFLVRQLIYQMHLRFYENNINENDTRYEQIESDEFLIFDELYEYLQNEVNVLFKNIEFDSLVYEIKKYLDNMYATPELNLQDISDKFNLSVCYICVRFKKITGDSINNYLTYIRMKHAKNLIKKGQYSAEQIAYMVGYTDPNYFCRVFKKNVGMTISEYRKKANEDII